MATIQSIDRAFTILRAIASQPDGIRLTDIIRRVGLPRSTVGRILATLETLDTIERVEQGQGYRIGPEIISLAMQPSYLITLVRPYLLELAEATGESVTLCLLEDDSLYYADQVHSHHSLQVWKWEGLRQQSLHIDSAGKVFLAYWSQEKQEHYLAQPLESSTEHSITDSDQLRQHLTEIRNQGYAWAREEFEIGLIGVSAPIWDQKGQVIAAINISGPKFRFPPPDQADEVIQLIVETCRQITVLVHPNLKSNSS